MKARALLCGMLLFAFAGAALAQKPGAAPRPQRADCAKAEDRKGCEARMAKARAARKELCAKSGDPARCEANASQRRRK